MSYSSAIAKKEKGLRNGKLMNSFILLEKLFAESHCAHFLW